MNLVHNQSDVTSYREYSTHQIPKTQSQTNKVSEYRRIDVHIHNGYCIKIKFIHQNLNTAQQNAAISM